MLSDEDSLIHRKYFVYIPNIASLSIVYVCNYKKERTQLQQRSPRHVCKDKNHENAVMKDNNATQSVYQRVFVRKGNHANFYSSKQFDSKLRSPETTGTNADAMPQQSKVAYH